MIFTECLECGHPIAVYLNEAYLENMKRGERTFQLHVCEVCDAENFIEHRRIDGETMNREAFEALGGQAPKPE